MKDIERILDKAGQEGRNSLSEPEVYEVFKVLGLDVPVYAVLEDIPSKRNLPGLLNKFCGDKIVVKISSPETFHKTESGGIRVVGKNPDELSSALNEMKSKFPGVPGILVCEFIEHEAFSMGQELMLGARHDMSFGPVITLGAGGTDAEELTAALKPGHSPSTAPLQLLDESGGWNRFLEKCWIWRYVSGRVRGGKRLSRDAEIIKWLDAFGRLMARFSDGSRPSLESSGSRSPASTDLSGTGSPSPKAEGNGTRWTVEEMEVNPLAVSARGRMCALDGLLRFRNAVGEKRTRPTARGVWSLLKPSSVAVAGVSEKKMNMGRIILDNVLSAGFDRSRTYVLKDYPGEINGVKCYPGASAFPDTVDMFVVAVPSKEVPACLKDAGSSGKVRGVVLISGGMGEKSGSENLQREVAGVIEDAKRTNPDFSVSGGNSLGIVSNPSKVNTLFIPTYKMAPPLGENSLGAKTAFISQSGAFMISAFSLMPGLKPVYSVSVGNQQDVTVADYVERVAQDPDIRVILAYVEGFKSQDGLVMARTIARAKKAGKTVVVYKAGRTATGSRAVTGHTASIAGDWVVTKAALESAGAMFADNFDDFNDMTMTACGLADFDILRSRSRPKPLRTFFLSNAGFETVGMADNVCPGRGLSAPVPGKELSEKLACVLKEFRLDGIVDVKNPLDVTPMANDSAILNIVKTVMSSGEIDAVVTAMIPLTPQMHTLPAGPGHGENFVEKTFLPGAAELARKVRKPFLFCVASGPLYDPYVSFAQGLGIPVFRSADRAVQIFSKWIGDV